MTTVLAIQGSLTVCLGTSLNYYLQPEATDSILFLILGVFAFLCAIAFGTLTQYMYQKSMGEAASDETSSNSNEDSLEKGGSASSQKPSDKAEESEQEKSNGLKASQSIQPMSQALAPVGASMTGAGDEKGVVDRGSSRNVRLGIIIAVLGGASFGFFSPCFNLADNDPKQCTLPRTRTACLKFLWSFIWLILSFCCKKGTELMED